MPGIADFASGFSRGLSSSRGMRLDREKAERAAQQQAFENRLGLAREQRMREALGLQEEQFERSHGLERRRFERQGRQFEQELGLERRRFQAQQEQFQSQQKIREKAANLQERKFEFQQKQADLKAKQSLLNLKNVPKGARKPFIRQQARAAGIDLDSPEYKEMESAIVSMQDEELKGIVDTMLGAFPDLPPGEAAKMAQGVFSGQITLDQLMTQMGERRQTEAAKRIMGGGQGQPRQGQQQGQRPTSTQRLLSRQPVGQQSTGAQTGQAPEGATQLPRVSARSGQGDEPVDLTSPGALRRESLKLTRQANELTRIGDKDRATRLEAQASDFRQMASDIEGAREFDPESVRRREEAQAQGEAQAARKQPMPNMFTRAAGLPRGFRMTRGEAEDLGYFVTAKQKDIREAHQHRAGAKTTLRQIDQLTNTLQNVDQDARDELVGAVGSVVRSVDTLISQALAGGKLLGYVTGGKSDSFRNSPEVQRVIRSEGLASQSSIVRSRVIDLAYNLARERESGRLSEQDVQRALEQIGNSGSADQMIATVQDLRGRVRRSSMDTISSIVGGPPLDMMTNNELLTFVRDNQDVLNDKLAGAILNRMADREQR